MVGGSRFHFFEPNPSPNATSSEKCNHGGNGLETDHGAVGESASEKSNS